MGQYKIGALTMKVHSCVVLLDLKAKVCTFSGVLYICIDY